MAISKDKIIQELPQQQMAPNTAVVNNNGSVQNAGANTTGSTFSSVEKKKEDPYLEFIKGEDFQVLSVEEQLEELKKKFPNVAEDKLQEILSTANTYIQNEEHDKTNELINTDTAEGQAIQLAASKGIKNPTIDDFKALYADLQKKDSKDLTDIEKGFMSFVTAIGSDDKTNSIKFLKENAKLLDSIIPEEVLQSKEWKAKSPKEKLDTKLDIILSQLNPAYKKMETPEMKQAYRNNVLGELAKQLFKNENMSAAETNYHVSVLAIITDAAEAKGIIMSQIVDMRPQQLTKFAINFVDENKLLSSFFEQNCEVVESKPYMLSLAKNIMEAADPEAFKGLNSEERDKIAANAICQLGQRLYGKDWQVVEGDPLATLEENQQLLNYFKIRFEAAKMAGEKTLAGVLGDGSIEFQKKAVAQDRQYCKEKNLEIDAEKEVEFQTRISTGKFAD